MGNRNAQLPDGHPLQCSTEGCKTKRRLARPPLCAKCLGKLRRGTLRGPPGAQQEVLPEDGIVDYIAVEVAAKGWRPVRLTKRERVLAAALIMAQSHDHVGEVIMDRLHISRTSAYRLVEFVKGREADVPQFSVSDKDASLSHGRKHWHRTRKDRSCLRLTQTCGRTGCSAWEVSFRPSLRA